MKRLSLLILWIIIVFISFSAVNCKYNSTESIEISIVVYDFFKTAYQTVFDSEDFKLRFPKITITLKTVEFAQHHFKLINRINSNIEKNDIVTVEASFMSEFLKHDCFINLNLYPYNAREASKKIAAFAIANASDSDQKLIGMPVFFSPSIMLYNKDFFEAAGVYIDKELKTWNDYLNLFKKFSTDINQDNQNDYYFLIDPYDLVTFSLNGDNGGWMIDDDMFYPEKKFINTLNVIQDFKRVKEKIGYSPFCNGNLHYTEFDNAVLFFVGPRSIQNYDRRIWRNFKDKFRIAHIPGIRSNSFAYNNLFFLSIPKTAEESKRIKSWEIIKYISTSEKAQILLSQVTPLFPVLTTVYNNPLLNLENDMLGGQVVNQIYRECAYNIPLKNISADDKRLKDIFRKAVDLVLKEDISPEEAFRLAKMNAMAENEI